MNQNGLLVSLGFLALIGSAFCSGEHQHYSGEIFKPLHGECYKATVCPEECPASHTPICAVDMHGAGYEFGNNCWLNRAVCKENHHFRRVLNGPCCNHGIRVLHHGH